MQTLQIRYSDTLLFIFSCDNLGLSAILMASSVSGVVFFEEKAQETTSQGDSPSGPDHDLVRSCRVEYNQSLVVVETSSLLADLNHATSCYARWKENAAACTSIFSSQVLVHYNKSHHQSVVINIFSSSTFRESRVRCCSPVWITLFPRYTPKVLSMDVSGWKSKKLKWFAMHKMQPTKCLSCRVELSCKRRRL